MSRPVSRLDQQPTYPGNDDVAVAPRRHRRYTTHGHLWTLRDGTPVHARPGQLTCDALGRIVCHLCGKSYSHLGAHIRIHGYSADEYRSAVGIPKSEPLCSGELSEQIASRQGARWQHDPDIRANLAAGQQLARSGQLNQLAVQASRDALENGTEDPLIAARRRAILARGRETQAGRVRQRIDHLVKAHPAAADFQDLLRIEYLAGSSLDALQRLTGLGRQHLREQLLLAGVTVRLSGHNTLASKHRRSADVDAAVATHVGTKDLYAWLQRQRAAGLTYAQLATVTGRSTRWVSSRLAPSPADAELRETS